MVLMEITQDVQSMLQLGTVDTTGGYAAMVLMYLPALLHFMTITCLVL